MSRSFHGEPGTRAPPVVVSKVMRRITTLMLAALAALAGGVIIDHGGDLPPDSYAADARFHDPWHGISSPLAAENMRHDMRR